MALFISKLSEIEDLIISPIMDRLWEIPYEQFTNDERLLMAIWPSLGFCGLEGIEKMIDECNERALDEGRDGWAELVEALDYFELHRLSFLKNGPDWVLRQSSKRRGVMSRIVGSGHTYVRCRIIKKVVEVGLVDLVAVDHKETKDELIRLGLLD